MSMQPFSLSKKYCLVISLLLISCVINNAHASLIEYQVKQLRKNETLLKTKIDELIINQEHCKRLSNEAYKLESKLFEITSIESLGSTRR